MGGSESKPPSVYSHNVLFLQEGERLMGFHFHDGQYEVFSVATTAKGIDMCLLGHTTLGFTELDELLRSHENRATMGGCHPPLCWTQSMLRSMQVPLSTDIAETNRLFSGIIVTHSPDSAAPLRSDSGNAI
jgi:hypothetical protein